MRCAVIGGGAIGAAIAYRLAGLGCAVSLLEAAIPGGITPEQSSGAALGVLLAASSAKATGDLAALRLAGLALWDRWLPEIEARSGQRVPYNQAGVWRLYGAPPKASEQAKLERAIASAGPPVGNCGGQPSPSWGPCCRGGRGRLLSTAAAIARWLPSRWLRPCCRRRDRWGRGLKPNIELPIWRN
ncbi:MAG: FAD-dependent oxidoreductase [Oscillatoriales cyanobacterium SM2_1_8]|nr:FAD-dependent oxidoreductase [Oscillatoriales cyanobacterium SM2_1_8]